LLPLGLGVVVVYRSLGSLTDGSESGIQRGAMLVFAVALLLREA
jgi:hypothetical protein